MKLAPYYERLARMETCRWTGAVILDSARGMLDSSAETQLPEIERGFADLVRRAQ